MPLVCDDSGAGKCGDGDAIALWVVMVLLAMVVRVRSGDTETIAGGCQLVETGDGISR